MRSQVRLLRWNMISPRILQRYGDRNELTCHEGIPVRADARLRLCRFAGLNVIGVRLPFLITPSRQVKCGFISVTGLLCFPFGTVCSVAFIGPYRPLTCCARYLNGLISEKTFCTGHRVFIRIHEYHRNGDIIASRKSGVAGAEGRVFIVRPGSDNSKRRRLLTPAFQLKLRCQRRTGYSRSPARFIYAG